MLLAAVLHGCAGAPTTPVTSGDAAGIGTTTILAAPGQSAALLTSPAFSTNLELVPGAQYLIAIVNTDASITATEDFSLVATYSPARSPQKAPTPTAEVPKRTTIRYRSSAAPEPRYEITSAAAKRATSMRTLQQHHLAMLDRDARILEDRQSFGALRPSAVPRVSVVQPRSISTTVGAVQRIYIARGLGGTCTDVDSIGARTVAVGQRVIVLADTDRARWPVGLRPDSTFYQGFANEYDAITWPHLLTYIGDPLILDRALSQLGKVTVVISPLLNRFGGGVASFVDACDFNQVRPGRSLGNRTEIFYYWTPDPRQGWSVQAWEDLMRATAAHETKHIVSFADHLINNGFRVRELTWLEEGLAQESSEIWERHFNRAKWKAHATFDQTVGCELDLVASGVSCDPREAKPLALSVSHLPFLFEYLQEESVAPTGRGLGTDTPSNYGAGWQFARWATDQYASTEGSFIKALIAEPALNGLPNLAKHTGRPIQELLVYWSLALAIFDTTSYTAADERTTNPSFDFANIFFSGQTKVGCSAIPCGLFSNTGSSTPGFPVQPTIDSATITPVRTIVTGVPGTAAYYILLVAPIAGTEHLELQSGTGGSIAPTSAMRVGMLRVR